MSLSPRIWDGVLSRLGAELPAFSLNAWVRPLALEAAGEGVCLVCPTAFHRDLVRDRYLPSIRRCLDEVAGRAVPVALSVAVAPARAEPAAAEPTAPAPALRIPRPEAAAPRRENAEAQQFALHTFDSFVVGPCNALAREACYSVARGSQERLELLYLASPTGLGKTHLARAVLAEARARGGDRALYASAESFTNQFTAALRARRMDEFKSRFRQRCRLLVVDDVQFLGSRSATQLELFHTLAHLLDAGGRVVLAGDRLPRDIAGLEPRLGSRMAAGLVAELEPPDARVRREILRSKAARGGVRLPEDCLDLLVDSLRGSVRDLTGALVQMVATAALLKRPIDLELTRSALRKLDASRPGPRRLTPESVVRAVAAFFKTAPEALASRSKRRDVLLPRQLAMYLCLRYTDASVREIARAFGRMHPSVTNARRAVEQRILEHAPLRYQVEALCARLDELERG